MVCICRWSGRGRVGFGGTACPIPGALAGAAGKAVVFAPKDCSRPPESKRVPPDAFARPATLSIGTAKLMFWPTLSDPTTIPNIRSEEHTSELQSLRHL